VRNGTNRSNRPQSPDPVRSEREAPRRQDMKKEPEEKPQNNGNVKSEMDVDEDDEDARLRKMMGITSFRSTKNTKVPGNQIYGVRKEKKTVYRQYMNRVGGFNRPLSPGR
jgi:U4/U6.U5 tri-snRNP-associated protein 3